MDSSTATSTQYPFSAIVGQEQMRLALLLNAIDPRVGGVLIRGEKGTAKSTMARALAELLPAVRVVAGCPYGCDPDDPGGRCDEHRAAARGELAVAKRPMRVVELPANATEDRLAGTLDVQAALARGERHFEPGLLARANRGILYVDEVNLLPDHLVDLLLDAAAMGRNVVEREGVSVAHPARFILIGTMNPEEGELRPQLLDRFGLCVDVTGLTDIEARVAVMRRRHAHEADPASFAAAWAPEQAALRDRVIRARALLAEVATDETVLRLIAGLSIEMGVDGHRADLVMLRAAEALAAFEGRTAVIPEDVRRAAALALPHRLRRRPFDQERFTDERLDEAMERVGGNGQRGAGNGRDGDGGEPAGGSEQRATESPRLDGAGNGQRADGGPPQGMAEGRSGASADARPTDAATAQQADASGQPDEGGRARMQAPGSSPGAPGVMPEAVRLPRIELARDRTARGGEGRRQLTLSDDGRGRFVRAARPADGAAGTRSDGRLSDIAVAATVRAAVLDTAFGARRQAPEVGLGAALLEPIREPPGASNAVLDIAQALQSAPSPVEIRPDGAADRQEPLVRVEHVRVKVRERTVGTSIVFIVDASGSMAARRRMEAAKGAALTLLTEAYQRRDRVALIAFRGSGAEVLLPLTDSVALAHRHLATLPAGGRTPLAAGLRAGLDLIRQVRLKDPRAICMPVLLTDGRANVAEAGGSPIDEALAAAEGLRLPGVHALILDTESGPVSFGLAARLADRAGARYLRLADLTADAVTAAVRGQPYLPPSPPSSQRRERQ